MMKPDPGGENTRIHHYYHYHHHVLLFHIFVFSSITVLVFLFLLFLIVLLLCSHTVSEDRCKSPLKQAASLLNNRLSGTCFSFCCCTFLLHLLVLLTVILIHSPLSSFFRVSIVPLSLQIFILSFFHSPSYATLPSTPSLLGRPSSHLFRFLRRYALDDLTARPHAHPKATHRRQHTPTSSQGHRHLAAISLLRDKVIRSVLLYCACLNC